MATNWIFYPQDPLIESATLTTTAGTCANIANCQNNRRGSLIDITALGSYISGSDEYMVKIDKGSSSLANFIALVDNNLYTDTGKMVLYHDDNDNAGLVDPSVSFSQQTAAATNEPIWVYDFSASPRTKRYHWLNLDTISTSAEFGCLLIGSIVEPVVDPNWELEIEIDIESGRIINKGPSGYNWKTRTHGIKRGWQVGYELLGDTDRDTLLNWITDSDYVETPFVFTPDGGTNYYYGELIGNPRIVTMQASLTNIEFTISEVIA